MQQLVVCKDLDPTSLAHLKIQISARAVSDPRFLLAFEERACPQSFADCVLRLLELHSVLVQAETQCAESGASIVVTNLSAEAEFADASSLHRAKALTKSEFDVYCALFSRMDDYLFLDPSVVITTSGGAQSMNVDGAVEALVGNSVFGPPPTRAPPPPPSE